MSLSARIFVGDIEGPGRWVGFFEDTGQTGDLYVSDSQARKVRHHVQVYVNRGNLRVLEDDVKVVWSDGGDKCGVVIWNGLRAVIDVRTNQVFSSPLQDHSSPPITDADVLRGFEKHLR